MAFNISAVSCWNRLPAVTSWRNSSVACRSICTPNFSPLGGTVFTPLDSVNVPVALSLPEIRQQPRNLIIRPQPMQTGTLTRLLTEVPSRRRAGALEIVQPEAGVDGAVHVEAGELDERSVQVIGQVSGAGAVRRRHRPGGQSLLKD